MLSQEQELNNKNIVEFARAIPIVNENGKDAISMVRNMFVDTSIEDVAEVEKKFIESPASAGKHLYRSIFHFSDKNQDEALKKGPFVIDLDSNDLVSIQGDLIRVLDFLSTSKLFKIPLHMMRVYFSGKKGIHIIIPPEIFGAEWCPIMDRTYQNMACLIKPIVKNCTFDMTMYQAKRVLRIPYSEHQGTGCYKVKIKPFDFCMQDVEVTTALAVDNQYGKEIVYQSPRLIKEAAATYEKCREDALTGNLYNIKRRQSQHEDESLRYQPPCVTNLLNSYPTEGYRNHSASFLISHFAQRGMSEEDTWERIEEWSAGEIELSELRKTFKSVFFGSKKYGCPTILKDGDLEGLQLCSAKSKKDCRFFKEG